jgi:hypothetical protein
MELSTRQSYTLCVLYSGLKEVDCSVSSSVLQPRPPPREHPHRGENIKKTTGNSSTLTLLHQYHLINHYIQRHLFTFQSYSGTMGKFPCPVGWERGRMQYTDFAVSSKSLRQTASTYSKDANSTLVWD